jgi:hypothetical protein
MPKIVFYAVQRLAVWSGTLYLFRKGKSRQVYYFYSAALYLTSWVLLFFVVRQVFALKLPTFPHFFPVLRRAS